MEWMLARRLFPVAFCHEVDDIDIMMKCIYVCMYVCHVFAYFLSEGRHVHSDDDDDGHDDYDKD